MGNSSSKTITEILNETAIGAIQESIQKCQQSVSQSQVIDVISGGNVVIGGNITQTQASVASLSCIQQAIQNGEIATNVANKIAQKIKAENEGTLAVLDKGTDAAAEAFIKNTIAINVTSLSSAVMNQYVAQSQRLNFVQKGDFTLLSTGNISQDQTARLVAEQLAATEQFQKAIVEIAGSVRQDNETKSKGVISSVVDTVAKLIGSATLALPLVIGMFLLFIAIAIGGPIVLFRRRRSGGDEVTSGSLMGLTDYSKF